MTEVSTTGQFWWELPTTDLAASAEFYRTVFGWEGAPMGEGYLILTRGEAQVGGLFAVDGDIGVGIRLTVEVDDLEATLATVTAAGGRVEVERTEIAPGMGWWADFSDPVGLRVGLSTSNPA